MKKLLSVFTIMAAGAFVSCDKNEYGIDNKTPNIKKEVNFSSNITKIELPLTRIAGTTWEKNDSIGIFMFKETSTEIAESKSNIKYTTANGGEVGTFLPTGEIIFFPDNNEKVRFMSYYPYTSDISSFTYKVDVSDQSKQSAIDLLYCFADTVLYDKITNSDKKVSLVFNHKLTKININIKPGDGLVGSDLENTVVSFIGFNTKADFNLISGTLSDPTEKNKITPLKITTAEKDYTVSFESIVIPVANPSDAKIVFDLNNGGDGINSDLFVWKFNTNELESGFEYIYNVTVKRSGIIVEAIIKEWENGGEKNIYAE